MRLTVGDLPAAVYWRRRAVVLVGIGLVVIIIVYACSGTGSATNGQPPSSPTTLHNVISVEPTSPGTTTTPPATAFTLNMGQASQGADPAASGACTDTEMSVTVKAAPAVVAPGQGAVFTITIRNTSARTCTRDIGADRQEMRLTGSDGKIVWTSDECPGNTGSQIYTFDANEYVSYPLNWNGRPSRTGSGQKSCTIGTGVPGGTYQLVGRLDQITSTPVTLNVQAPGS
jgi:hypothetical protein